MAKLFTCESDGFGMHGETDDDLVDVRAKVTEE
jgi:hypothetical protein